MSLVKLNIARGVTGTLPSANFSGGKVSQVINGTSTTEVVTSSSSWQDTGLTASITPSATSSKILIIATIAGVGKDGDGYVILKTLRDSTDISVQFENRGGDTNTSNTNKVGSCSFSYLDSPSTTSSTAYKVQVKGNGNSYAQTGDSNPKHTMTLMEILA
tara:strand:- start:215 stop:694 length:480 start_codon:yes stop_codon:yes gene_type:complete